MKVLTNIRKNIFSCERCSSEWLYHRIPCWKWLWYERLVWPITGRK